VNGSSCSQVTAHRRLGPAAFVETSKLERQVLVLEKELELAEARRKQRHEASETILLRRGTMQLALLIWVLYYAVPLVTVDDSAYAATTSSSDSIAAAAAASTTTGAFVKTLMFPIASVGFGFRISRWGLPAEAGASSLGALVILWSAQVTVGKLMDAVEAYCLIMQQ
jgi:hypothetical protein